MLVRDQGGKWAELADTLEWTELDGVSEAESLLDKEVEEEVSKKSYAIRKKVSPRDPSPPNEPWLGDVFQRLHRSRNRVA